MLALFVGTIGFSQEFNFNCAVLSLENSVSFSSDNNATSHTFTVVVSNPSDVSEYEFTVNGANYPFEGNSITVENLLLISGTIRVNWVVTYIDGTQDFGNEDVAFVPVASTISFTNDIDDFVYTEDIDHRLNFDLNATEFLVFNSSLTINGEVADDYGHAVFGPDRYVLVRVREPGVYNLTLEYGDASTSTSFTVEEPAPSNITDIENFNVSFRPGVRPNVVNTTVEITIPTDLRDDPTVDHNFVLNYYYGDLLVNDPSISFENGVAVYPQNHLGVYVGVRYYDLNETYDRRLPNVLDHSLIRIEIFYAGSLLHTFRMVE